MEIDDEEEEEQQQQQQTEAIESPEVKSRRGSTDETATAEQAQTKSLIQSLLLEQIEEIDDKKKKKKKKIKTGRQKELVKIFVVRKILYSIFFNIGTFDKSNKNYLYFS
jgi:hypothetical protein